MTVKQEGAEHSQNRPGNESPGKYYALHSKSLSFIREKPYFCSKYIRNNEVLQQSIYH
jgi:hypothetical protein